MYSANVRAFYVKCISFIVAITFAAVSKDVNSVHSFPNNPFKHLFTFAFL